MTHPSILLLRHSVKRPRQHVERTVYLLPGNHERRLDSYYVAKGPTHAHQHSILSAVGANCLGLGDGGSDCAGLHQLDTYHQPQAAHFTNCEEALLQPLEPRKYVFAVM